jgi:hypothetical protein
MAPCVSSERLELPQSCPSQKIAAIAHSGHAPAGALVRQSPYGADLGLTQPAISGRTAKFGERLIEE